MFAAFTARHGHQIAELWRYYRIGLLNTAFGFGLYSLLVACGLNIFAAQILSHLAGATFNYFTFSRHVFHESRGAFGPYIAAYAINYCVGLILLALASSVVHSPYLAGFLALIGASLINYAVLKRFVFRTKART